MHGKRDKIDLRELQIPIPAVVHEDDQLLVVAKPAGLSSVPGRSGPESVLSVMMGSGRPGTEELRLVHRLDRGTSGVLVLTKSLDAQRMLSEQFSAGRVDKVYLALIGSRPFEMSGVIDVPIAVPKDLLGKAKIDPKDGKPAVTEWEVAEMFRGYTLLRCRPRTGRTHQIRVHLNHAFMPLAVDPVYGGGERIMLSAFKNGYRPSKRRPEQPLLSRLSLHAESIAFDHPADGARVTYRVEPPKDLAVTLRQLRKWAG
jgi:RluA family pseudouridine synthase